MNKAIISAAILLSLSNTSQAANWQMTGGSFDFYDQTGVLSSQFPDGYSHHDVQGEFNFVTGTGSFTSNTQLSGAFWNYGFSSIEFGPETGTTDARFDWLERTYEDTFTLQRFTCRVSLNGVQDSCGEFEIVHPDYYELLDEVNTATDTLRDGSPNLSTGYSYTLAQDQIAIHTFINWAGNLDIPSLVVMQITGRGVDENGFAYMDLVPVDTDGDGVPGTVFQTGPFPGLTVAIGGRIIEFDSEVPRVSSVKINTDSDVYQCLTNLGTDIAMSAEVNASSPDLISSITWSVDGVVVGQDESINTVLTLGVHDVSVEVLGVNGEVVSDSTSVSVIDTAPPEIFISFTDSKGLPVTNITRNGLNDVTVNYESMDACDVNPVMTAIGGVTVENKSVLRINPTLENITVNGDVFLLSVTATDASGNKSEKKDNLIITQ